jgi:hypothetical protein
MLLAIVLSRGIASQPKIIADQMFALAIIISSGGIRNRSEPASRPTGG